MFDELAYAQAYPLVRGGGLFLMVVALGMLAGGVVPRIRRAALAVAAVIAVLLTAWFARGLAAPTALQVGALVGAVALEIALIPLVARRVWRRGPRVVTLAVLMVVGVHFLPMAPAFGQWMLVLALLACAVSGAGLLFPRLPLAALWLLDALAKLAVGGAMWSIGI